MKYVCELCGYIYDELQGNPEQGIAPGTPFTAIHSGDECPLCGCRLEVLGEQAQEQKYSQR